MSPSRGSPVTGRQPRGHTRTSIVILGMAFPNLVGVVLLSGRVKRELDAYLGKLRAGELQRY